MASRKDPLVGQLFAGRYQIEGLIAEGGMGKVYRARQDAPSRTVAVKVVRQDLASGANAVERFRREMSATALIEHPHTVRVYDFGQSDHGELYYAMELLDGITLRQALAPGPIEPRRVVHIARQVAKALGAAHAKGIVHRDIKPDNVMLTQPYGERDYVKVLDFGLARFAETGPGERRELTATGLVLGTPDYMAPEQAEDKGVDARTDIYALGCVLYHLLTGNPPFTATTPLRVLYKHLHEPPRPLEELRADLPADLRRLVAWMLAKAPADRPASTHEVITALDEVTRALGGTPPVDTTPVRPPEAWSEEDAAPTDAMEALPRHEPRRSPLLWAIAAAAVLAAAFAARMMLPDARPATELPAVTPSAARPPQPAVPKEEIDARVAAAAPPEAAPPDAPTTREDRAREAEQPRLRVETLAEATPPPQAEEPAVEPKPARDKPSRPTAARPRPEPPSPTVKVKPW